MSRNARDEALRILSSEKKMAKTTGEALDARERGLANELVQGVLRWRNLLDHVISAFCSRRIGDISPRVLSALRLGVYQMLFLGTPAYAAVNSVVELFPSKKERAFINGVLRAFARNLGHVNLPSIDDDPLEYASRRFSYPVWIIEELLKVMDLAEVFRFLATENQPQPVTLRVRFGKRDWLLDLLKGEGYHAEPGRLDISIKVSGGGAPWSWPGFDTGLFAIQDEGSMLASLCLNPRAGDLIWDMCAAPGGKTCHLADLVSWDENERREDGRVSETEINAESCPKGMVFASDVDEGRLKLIEENVTRLQLKNVRVFMADASCASQVKSVFGEYIGEFDGILLDAPCSGLGVMAKNADLRWQRRRTDIPRMAQRQRSLLDVASRFLKKGGSMVYSVCTLTYEETKGVIEDFLHRHPEFRVDDSLAEYVSSVMGLAENEMETLQHKGLLGKGFCYLLPQVHGTDGFFISKLVKAG